MPSYFARRGTKPGAFDNEEPYVPPTRYTPPPSEPPPVGGGGVVSSKPITPKDDGPFTFDPTNPTVPDEPTRRPPNDPTYEYGGGAYLGPESEGTPEWMGWLERQRRGQAYDDPYGGQGQSTRYQGKAGFGLENYGDMTGMDTSGFGTRTMSGMPEAMRRQMATDITYQMPIFGDMARGYARSEGQARAYQEGMGYLNDLTGASRTGAGQLREDDRRTYGSTLRRYGNYGR